MVAPELRGRWLGSVALILALALALPAAAQEVRRINVLLTVSHASPNTGPIDAGAADLHRILRREFRYESLRVIQSKSLDLDLDDVGSLKLPTGSWLRVKPLSVGQNGALIAVDVEGQLKTDLRVPNRKQVVIGAQGYQGGKLIIMLEPRY